MDCGDNEIVLSPKQCCNRCRKHIVTCREAQSCMHGMSLTMFAIATDQEAVYAFAVMRHEEKLYIRSIKLGLENSIIHLKLLGIEEVIRWSQNSNHNSITIHSNIYSSLQNGKIIFKLSSSNCIQTTYEYKSRSTPWRLSIFSWSVDTLEWQGNEIAYKLVSVTFIWSIFPAVDGKFFSTSSFI